MSRASKNVYHPNGNADNFSDVETALDSILFGSTPVVPAAVIKDTLGAAHGGTGLATLTAHAVLLGEGTSSVAFAAPGGSGQPLLSNGSSSDPSFQAWVDGIGGFISFPDNVRYDLWLNAPFAFTIVATTTFAQSGSCTATWQVNASGVGTANSVSTTQQTQTQNISVTVGQTVNMNISSNSSCQGMSFMIKYTRP